MNQCILSLEISTLLRCHTWLSKPPDLHPGETLSALAIQMTQDMAKPCDERTHNVHNVLSMGAEPSNTGIN